MYIHGCWKRRTQAAVVVLVDTTTIITAAAAAAAAAATATAAAVIIIFHTSATDVCTVWNWNAGEFLVSRRRHWRQNEPKKIQRLGTESILLGT